MQKIMVVFGTRPEAIKMAPVVRALREAGDHHVLICVTGQHRAMLRGVLETFEISPDIDLDIMRDRQDLFDVTVSVLLGMRKVLREHQPDLVMVHGDTTTSYSAALASYYCSTPIAHVEAGLRTHNLYAPFPEEFNRRSIGTLARWHFAPTDIARENLIREGVSSAHIFVTGNTVADALRMTRMKLDADSDFRNKIESELEQRLGFRPSAERFVLVTGHRRENLGVGFASVFDALRALAEAFGDTYFVYPMHPNPTIRMAARESLRGLTNVKLLDPFEYGPFVALMSSCYLVLTDSGGIQEEAPILGKPVILMREVTERPEGLAAGAVKIVGTNPELIIEAVGNLLTYSNEYEEMSRETSLVGDGFAAGRIASIITEGDSPIA